MEHMCLDLINSRWYITHEPYADPLRYSNWVADFLKRWDLTVPISISEHVLMQLKMLRTTLSHMVDTLCNGGEISGELLQEINNYLTLTPVYYELIQEEKAYKTISRPAKTDWNYVLTRITASFVKLITEHDLRLIKKCENPECGWVFFDKSKNHTRRWCGNSCSSLIKVRHFRERQRRLKFDIKKDP